MVNYWAKYAYTGSKSSYNQLFECKLCFIACGNWLNNVWCRRLFLLQFSFVFVLVDNVKWCTYVFLLSLVLLIHWFITVDNCEMLVSNYSGEKWCWKKWSMWEVTRLYVNWDILKGIYPEWTLACNLFRVWSALCAGALYVHVLDIASEPDSYSFDCFSFCCWLVRAQRLWSSELVPGLSLCVLLWLLVEPRVPTMCRRALVEVPTRWRGCF